MNAHNDHVERKQNAAASAIDVWENEGGAHGHGALDHHYGRRVEVDRSWTVYHVFTGVPARIGGNAIIGHDGMFEVPFFVETAALAQPGRQWFEADFLAALDSTRNSIQDVAREAYSHGRRTSYTLTAADFR